jgi:hypothetical protein
MERGWEPACHIYGLAWPGATWPLCAACHPIGFSSPGNPRRLSQRRSTLCGNYERFNNSNAEKDVFNIHPKKGSKETFPERFNNCNGEDEKQKGAFNM